jgi:hypothetical protein
MKPTIYLGSSALKSEGFDHKKTVQAALKYGFFGVQLGLDERYNPRALDEKSLRDARLLAAGRLDIIAHLPDVSYISKRHIDAAKLLMQLQPRKVAIVHYDSSRGTEFYKRIDPTGVIEICLENAVNGMDLDHLKRWELCVKGGELLSVFDIGRIKDSKSPEGALQVIRKVINEKWVYALQIIDKDAWSEGSSPRCAFGRGVYTPILPLVRNFEGPIIIEHEDLGQAIESKENILR